MSDHEDPSQIYMYMFEASPLIQLNPHDFPSLFQPLQSMNFTRFS